MKRIKLKKRKLDFALISYVFSFVDIETKVNIKLSGLKIDRFFNFFDNNNEIFSNLINQKRFYFKTLSKCLTKGHNGLPSNIIISPSNQILKYYNKLEMAFNRIRCRSSKFALIILGSPKSLKYRLNINETLLLLINYFRRVDKINKEFILKVFSYLSELKPKDNVTYFMTELIKIIPEDYQIEFCEVIHNFDHVHLINENKTLFKNFLKKFPNYIFVKCVKEKKFAKRLSISLFNWNNNLLKVLYNHNPQLLILLGNAYINRSHQVSESKQETYYKKAKMILNSSNKIPYYVNYVKNF